MAIIWTRLTKTSDLVSTMTMVDLFLAPRQMINIPPVKIVHESELEQATMTTSGDAMMVLPTSRRRWSAY